MCRVSTTILMILLVCGKFPSALPLPNSGWIGCLGRLFCHPQCQYSPLSLADIGSHYIPYRSRSPPYSWLSHSHNRPLILFYCTLLITLSTCDSSLMVTLIIFLPFSSILFFLFSFHIIIHYRPLILFYCILLITLSTCDSSLMVTLIIFLPFSSILFFLPFSPSFWLVSECLIRGVVLVLLLSKEYYFKLFR